MITDRFAASYLSSVLQEIKKLKDELSVASFDSLYDLGRIQGRIAGLELSMQLLETSYEDQDK